jgi:hypothetical protein
MLNSQGVASLRRPVPEGETRLRSYSAYGLAILSGLSLPELHERPDSNPAQVTICAGPVAHELAGRTARGGLFEVASGMFLLQMEGVARYLVSGGNRITIDAAPGADEDSIRLFLFGSVFGALLHQRGLLPLHASAIETPVGAVLFAGDAASGKSALAAAFLARGYRVIADEICVVETGPGSGISVIPALPRLLLWRDVIEQTGLWGENVRPARANLKKYHVPLQNGFASEPSSIHAVYVLKSANAREFNVTRIAGLDKFRESADLIFRKWFLSGMCPGNNHFHQLTRLARDVRISRVERPSSRPLQETAELLEKDFSQ